VDLQLLSVGSGVLSHVKGCEMKWFLLSLTIVIVVGSTALSPANAWGTQAQPVYNWGDPWGAPSGLPYYGPTPVDGVPGTIVQISTSNSASYALTKTGEVWAWGVGQEGRTGQWDEAEIHDNARPGQIPSGRQDRLAPEPNAL
jgi:hypothetical protein